MCVRFTFDFQQTSGRYADSAAAADIRGVYNTIL